MELDTVPDLIITFHFTPSPKIFAHFVRDCLFIHLMSVTVSIISANQMGGMGDREGSRVLGHLNLKLHPFQM